jgi:formiminotetrahydrofolate cyclodeaminase
VAAEGNVNAASDAAAGAHLALAAAEAAALNVKININSLIDEGSAKTYRSQLESYLGDARSLAASAIQTAQDRAGLN